MMSVYAGDETKIPTFLDSPNNKLFFSSSENIIVNVSLSYLDKDGDVLEPLSGKIVTANVNNKEDSIETDENGVAIFNFGQLAAGNYSIWFYFNEDDEYQGYSHDTNVEVVPVAPPNPPAPDPPAPDPPDYGVDLSATGFNLLLLLAMFCVLVVGFVKR